MRKIIYTILSSIAIFSCAQIVAPTGGQKDSNPPSLINAFPANETKNFRGKEITLVFDELIDISSLRNELLVVPELEGGYETKIKNNQLTIKLNQPLKDSTTYSFNFRNGIKDLTEKNPTKNLKLVLSTGDNIDSLSIKGKVIDLFSKEELLNITVGLYTSDTLDMNRKKPMYFTKTDSSGDYKLENIKAGKYFVLAIDDKNSNLRLDEKDERFGFIKDSINVNVDINAKNIEIYPSNRTPNKVKRVIARETEFVVNLDKTPKKVITNNEIPFSIGDKKITFFKLKENLKDTTLTQIVMVDSLLTTDTLNQNIYFNTPLKPKKRKTEIISIQSSVAPNKEILANTPYVLKFDKPLIRFDENKIELRSDSVLIEIPKLKKINNLEYVISTEKKPEKDVELIIYSNAIENYLGDTNSVWSLKNKVLTKEELGLIEGSTIDSSSTKIAQLIDISTGKIVLEDMFKEKFIFKEVIPGSYQIRVIFDENENGIWDPGNIYTLELPEKILTTANPIRVRANFELRNIKVD